jgi:hypothetical protein
LKICKIEKGYLNRLSKIKYCPCVCIAFGTDKPLIKDVYFNVFFNEKIYQNALAEELGAKQATLEQLLGELLRAQEEERKRIIEARNAQTKAATEASEKARMEAEAKPAEKQVADAVPAGSEPPKEATVFGG